jgi:hypothetical protein
MVSEVQPPAVERSRVGRTAQESRAEARSLFVGEPDHLYGVGKTLSPIVQLLYARYGDHHPEYAVVCARVAYGI